MHHPFFARFVAFSPFAGPSNADASSAVVKMLGRVLGLPTSAFALCGFIILLSAGPAPKVSPDISGLLACCTLAFRHSAAHVVQTKQQHQSSAGQYGRLSQEHTQLTCSRQGEGPGLHTLDCWIICRLCLRCRSSRAAAAEIGPAAVCAVPRRSCSNQSGTSQPAARMQDAISFSRGASSSTKNVMAVPCRPARPVRPTLQASACRQLAATRTGALSAQAEAWRASLCGRQAHNAKAGSMASDIRT
jgi:hypothetical protein